MKGSFFPFPPFFPGLPHPVLERGLALKGSRRETETLRVQCCIKVKLRDQIDLWARGWLPWDWQLVWWVVTESLLDAILVRFLWALFWWLSLWACPWPAFSKNSVRPVQQGPFYPWYLLLAAVHLLTHSLWLSTPSYLCSWVQSLSSIAIILNKVSLTVLTSVK